VRFLADVGVSITTVEGLRAADHDAVHLREEGLIRLPDAEIASKAVRERRIVLTFDLDFGDILAAARAQAPSVIIFRLRNQTPAAVNPRLFRVIADCESELASGAIIIVEDEGYRVRQLPIHQ
jgi:predicted nuclease of predicted toxin-antitoxin system